MILPRVPLPEDRESPSIELLSGQKPLPGLAGGLSQLMSADRHARPVGGRGC